MKISPYEPKKLPIKHLNTSKIGVLLGNGREALARLDETVIRLPSKVLLEPLYWQEAISSLRSKEGKSAYLEILKEQLSPSPEGDPLIQRIIAAKEALFIAKGSRNILNINFLCKIHKILKRDSPKKEDVGVVRTRQNWIGRKGCSIEEAYFYPPNARFVKPLLRNLFSYLAKDEDPLLQSAIGFAQLLIIHPFMDGNGRLARIFAPIYLVRRGVMKEPALFLSPYFERDRLKYFRRLFEITTTDRWEEWISYYLRGVSLQAEKTQKKLLLLKAFWEKCRDLVGEKAADSLFRSPLQKKTNSPIQKKLIKEKILIPKRSFLILKSI